MLQAIDKTENQSVYTVSRLNNEARTLLEEKFAVIWVEGEISNFAAPNSGHWYFSLKDSSAQVRCALFRANKRKLDFVPKDGMHVLIKARVSLYENRGEFQLIAEEIEERGEGKLQRAFELLKKKLHALGLFDAIHKKPLPIFPKQIGVVTSPTGAAIRDILIVLKRRFPCASVIIYPTLVQGSTAANEIVRAIETANRRSECDVLILSRGGGSLEDLWPFNEENVAHAIFASQLPIISGIGHEIDYTIADFVADKRAPTPSAAAEMVTPNLTELNTTLNRYHHILLRHIAQKIELAKKQLNWMNTHLAQQHPKRKLLEKMQRVDFFEATLIQLFSKSLMKKQATLQDLNHRLQRQIPTQQIKNIQHKLFLEIKQLQTFIVQQIQRKQQALTHLAAKLDGISPLATLKRGYAIAVNNSNTVLTDSKQVKVKDTIAIKLFKGELHCIVTDKD